MADALPSEQADQPRSSSTVRAWRSLRRRPAFIASAATFALLVGAALMAPLWANVVAGTTPYENHLSDVIEVRGETVNVVGLDGVPIGPTWGAEFFLGADRNGRDVMVRLLYGARISLMIGLGATFMTMTVGLALGVAGGFMRGWIDAVISRLLELMWSFPVLLLGIALGTALALGGIQMGPVTIQAGSLAIPTLVIALVYIPYVARPIRGEVLAMREREFVQSARGIGMGPLRIMFSEVAPNLVPTAFAIFPLLVANAILLESALSFLGAGVQPPAPSWGTMLDEGVDRILTAPALAIAPGVMLVLTVLSLNVLADELGKVLRPQGRLRVAKW